MKSPRNLGSPRPHCSPEERLPCSVLGSVAPRKWSLPSPFLLSGDGTVRENPGIATAILPLTRCIYIRIPVKKRWEHVFRCYEKRCKAEFGFAQFCFLCNTWKTSKTDWEAHCQGHIDNQEAPFRCNLVTFRTAVACAGYCPRCLSNDSLPAAKRMYQYMSRSNWLRHIHDCIPNYIQTRCDPSRVPCLHERCPVVCPTGVDLWHHLEDVYSIPKPVAGKRPRDCSDEAPSAVAKSSNAAKKCRAASSPAGQISDYRRDVLVKPGFTDILPVDLRLMSTGGMDKVLVLDSPSSLSFSSEESSIFDTETIFDGYSSASLTSFPSPNMADIEGINSLAIGLKISALDYEQPPADFTETVAVLGNSSSCRGSEGDIIWDKPDDCSSNATSLLSFDNVFEATP